MAVRAAGGYDKTWKAEAAQRQSWDAANHEATMNIIPEFHARDEAVYRRLKDAIARTYPHGRFVAIADEQVVADAANLQALDAQLQSLGRDPRVTFVVQAGVDYPEYAIILL